MTTPVNPHSVSWTDPVTATDQNGNPVPWSNADRAGISIKFDGAAVVSVPLGIGVQSFDLTQLAAYQALPVGEHILALAVVTKEGITGSFASDVPFLTAVVPTAPTSVAVA